jgi:hypothetical protein
MPIYKITRKKGGATRVIDAPTRAQALRKLTTDEYEIRPATIPEVVAAYEAHKRRSAAQPTKDTP